ncbi:hypothetical protein MMC27_002813 [Xylographa pallens]|nr:hypothetical protein [Xylographa pallens]
MWKQVSFPPISAKSSDCFTQLQNTIVQPAQGVASDQPDAAAIVECVSSKWQTLLYYAQSKISESKAPLSGDVHLVAEVIQRKHDFEKMERVMQANTESARMLLGVESADKRLVELHSYGNIIGSWALQLEKVAASLLGLLAIQESLKASKQAVRTQNLTILAFVFIPVSTVSSIYGMNTVEIAQNNPRTWQFGLTAAVTTTAAILAAVFYQYWATLPKSCISMFRMKSRRPGTSTPQFATDPSTVPAHYATMNQQHATIIQRPQKPAPSAYHLQNIPQATPLTTANLFHPNSSSDSELGEAQITGGPPPDALDLLANPQIAGSQCIVM